MKACAIFDLDKTILATPSKDKTNLLEKFKPDLRKAIIKLIDTNDGNFDQVKSLLSALTKGKTQEEVISLVSEVLTTTGETQIFQEAIELINFHKERNDEIIIVSTAPIEVVQIIAEQLGVEHIIATRSEIDSDGCYTGRIIFFSFGEAKALAIKDFARVNKISLSDSYAYSDSISDLPILEIVGHPIVCNPDNELLDVAKSRQWDIKMYFDTENLWAKMPPAAKKTAIIGPIAAAAGAITIGIIKSRISKKRKSE